MALVVVAIVVFDWAVTAKHALDTGIFNFDSLWYHMPFSADIAQSHSTTGISSAAVPVRKHSSALKTSRRSIVCSPTI